MAMAQAVAGHIALQGEPAAAVLTLVGHHCILRTGEMFELRTGDCTLGDRGVLLVLRETKMGQRIGVHQETTVKDPWLAARLKRVFKHTRKGDKLMGCSPDRYRACWSKARKALGLPKAFTPYALRRGGATALFQHSGSVAKVAERGGWHSQRAMRGYINNALADLAGESMYQNCTKVQQTFSQHLHRLPAKDGYSGTVRTGGPSFSFWSSDPLQALSAPFRCPDLCRRAVAPI